MIACCNSRVPAVAVYFVRPAAMARPAACLIFSGVSKSGSPAPKSTTLTPCARNASAACMAASVDDACIFETFSETGNSDGAGLVIGDLLCFLLHSRFNLGRYQSIQRAAQLKHFFHESRADIRISFSGHHENSFYRRFKAAVHQSH